MFIEFCLCLTAFSQGGHISGTVRDGRTGESLATVAVQLVETHETALTGASGRFELGPIEAGAHTLKISTVGYHMAQVHFELKADETRELDIVLSPDASRRTERVEVRG